MLRKYKEPILLLGIMALAIFMLLEANSIHIGRGRTPVGPAVWPRVMLGGMLLFSVILFVMDLLKIRKGNVLEVRQDDGESADTADLAENRSEYPLRGLFTLVFPHRVSDPAARNRLHRDHSGSVVHLPAVPADQGIAFLSHLSGNDRRADLSVSTCALRTSAQRGGRVPVLDQGLLLTTGPTGFMTKIS